MRKNNFVSTMSLLIIVLFLAACEMRTPPPAPIIYTLPPAPTKTSVATLELPSPTVTSTPQSGGNILYRDEFTGTLGSGWTWMLEYPNSWSLTAVPQALQIMAGSGYVNSGNITNVLLRSSPEGNFEFETLLTFEPSTDFQFAGLLVYESNSHFLQAGREFCSTGATCNGDGLYFDYFSLGKFQRENYQHQYAGGPSVYLQIRRAGQAFTFLASTNGFVWQEIGRRDIEINPRYIGLMAGQNPRQSIPANFDYFEVRSLP